MSLELLNDDSPPPGGHVAVGRRGASKKDAAFRIDCNVISGVQDFHVCFWLSRATVVMTKSNTGLKIKNHDNEILGDRFVQESRFAA